MVDFVRLAATAQRLIEANGRTINIRKLQRTPADPNKPWRGPADGELDKQTVTAAILPASGSGFGRELSVGATAEEAFTEIALVAADSLSGGVNLEEYDTVTDATQSWQIVRIDTLKPADTPVIYTLRLNR